MRSRRHDEALFAELVLAITIAILIVLFSAQRYGTDAVGAAFAPILIVWFISIAGKSSADHECLPIPNQEFWSTTLTLKF